VRYKRYRDYESRRNSLGAAGRGDSLYSRRVMKGGEGWPEDKKAARFLLNQRRATCARRSGPRPRLTEKIATKRESAYVIRFVRDGQSKKMH